MIKVPPETTTPTYSHRPKTLRGPSRRVSVHTKSLRTTITHPLLTHLVDLARNNNIAFHDRNTDPFRTLYVHCAHIRVLLLPLHHDQLLAVTSSMRVYPCSQTVEAVLGSLMPGLLVAFVGVGRFSEAGGSFVEY